MTSSWRLIQSLNFEKAREHFRTIGARDQRNPQRLDFVHVQKTVLDVNANRPWFESEYHHVIVSVATEKGTAI